MLGQQRSQVISSFTIDLVALVPVYVMNYCYFKYYAAYYAAAFNFYVSSLSLKDEGMIIIEEYWLICQSFDEL